MSTSMLKPLILHAHSTGPNPYKVAIALEALNIPYHVKVWEFGDAANGVKGPEFLKINPNG
jgi:glutathione S-transferase